MEKGGVFGEAYAIMTIYEKMRKQQRRKRFV